MSIIVPLYNERESLQILCTEIEEAARKAALEVEAIFVDDGSSDGSWQVIKELAGHKPWVHGVRFRRNFGKAAALSAGFHAARGDLVLTMDSDLQDDPKEISAFVTALDKGLDVVSGWKRVRHDPWHKVAPSRVFNWMVSRMTGAQLKTRVTRLSCGPLHPPRPGQPGVNLRVTRTR